MGAWIVTVLMVFVLEGIYRSSLYLLNFRLGDTGPPLAALLFGLFAWSFFGCVLYVFFGYRRQEELPRAADSYEAIASQTIMEEVIRFVAFMIVFGLCLGVSKLLGLSHEGNPHPWISHLGWPGIVAGLVSNLVFTALHVRKDGELSGFMPIVPGTIFTVALLNDGLMAAIILHLAYNTLGYGCIKAVARRPHT